MPKIHEPIIANSETLDSVLRVGLPTLLVLYHRHIAPSIAHTMRLIAQQEAGNLLVIKADAAENPTLAFKYDLSKGTPIVVAYKDRKEVARHYRTTSAMVEKYAAFLLGRLATLDEPAAPSRPSVMIQAVTDATFIEQVLHSPIPVLVDFWADWCAPCHIITPYLERLADEFAGQITIVKVDVDTNLQTARQYRISGIPNLLIFKSGRVVDRMVGAMPEPIIRQFIQKHLGN
jgi:thioredoxin 1